MSTKVIKRGALLTFLAVAIVAGWIPFSRYTNMGIFAAGGGRYWVRQAASAQDSAKAKAHLRRVLEINQYGVNIAENAVRALGSRPDRIRLWQLLIELAPNENWRNIYALDLQKEYSRPPN